jgi:hypothetical protein
MGSNFGFFILLAFTIILPTLFIIAIAQNRTLIPPPKERDFGLALADWARQQGLFYTPQKVYVISGVYKGRWFTIGTANEENALWIRMRLKNPQRNTLQIFANWLEDSGVVAFVNRFRIYSSPSGLGETLFDKGTKLRASLSRFPDLRARLDLCSDPKDPNHLQYSLLTDLPGAEMLETIMASMHRFCEAFENEVMQEGTGNAD